MRVAWIQVPGSLHLSYLPSESTMSNVFSFLEAPSIGFFAGVFTKAIHKREGSSRIEDKSQKHEMLCRWFLQARSK